MDGLAIDRQRQDCEALAEQRGWDVVHTYVDQSISASKKDVDRPDYDAMVASLSAARSTRSFAGTSTASHGSPGSSKSGSTGQRSRG